MQNHWWQDGYIKAYRFAARAHNGQTFVGTDLPYVMHVTLVCMEVMAAFRVETGHDESLGVQCALLHDVIEDTNITHSELRMEFGETVADGVLALSKDFNLAKDLQLEDSLQRIRRQPTEVWMVKLADRITNLQPPPSHWSETKIVSYRGEASRILETLEEASPVLAVRLRAKIEAYPVCPLNHSGGGIP